MTRYDANMTSYGANMTGYDANMTSYGANMTGYDANMTGSSDLKNARFYKVFGSSAEIIKGFDFWDGMSFRFPEFLGFPVIPRSPKEQGFIRFWEHFCGGCIIVTFSNSVRFQNSQVPVCMRSSDLTNSKVS